MEWDKLLIKNFYSVPGEHGIIIGATGSGKTQMLYYIMQGLRKYNPEEHFIWLDCGKSSEILKLMEFGELLIHHPSGTKVDFILKNSTNVTMPIFKEFHGARTIWNNLSKDKINVVCLEPFHPDPDDYSIEITDLFKYLILKARRYEFEDAGLIPMTIFIDELHWLVPAEKSALNREHNIGAKWFQRNIELLRSMKIRIVGSTQGWMKLRPGARESFSWLFVKRGARFSIDKPRLSKFNSTFQRLQDDEMIIVTPDTTYSNPITTEFYGRGGAMGRVRYQDAPEPAPVEPAGPIYA